jgi:hypothetical protein
VLPTSSTTKKDNDEPKQLVIIYSPSKEEKTMTSFANSSSFVVH